MSLSRDFFLTHESESGLKSMSQLESLTLTVINTY